MTYNDSVYIRAVELGCFPRPVTLHVVDEKLGTSLVTLWLCCCPSRINHGDRLKGVITLNTLADYADYAHAEALR